MEPVPLGGAVKEEMFLQPGKLPHGQGDQPGQSGSFGALEENAATGLQQLEQEPP